jgi:DNA repair photolyase
VLVEAAKRADVSVTFSIPTLDLEIWRRTEPGTAPPLQRLRALSQLVQAGLKASVGMAPIIPGLSDKPELMADVVRAARAAGATGVWANVLYLKPGTKEHFLSALEQDWPELLPQYEHLYGRRAYLPAEKTNPVREQVRALAREHGIRDRRRVRLEPPADPEQLSLAV